MTSAAEAPTEIHPFETNVAEAEVERRPPHSSNTLAREGDRFRRDGRRTGAA